MRGRRTRRKAEEILRVTPVSKMMDMTGLVSKRGELWCGVMLVGQEGEWLLRHAR